MMGQPHAHDIRMGSNRHYGALDGAPNGVPGAERQAPARRTAGDVLVGVLLIGGGVLILGNVAMATVISVFLLGWMAVISGASLLAAALWRSRAGGFWSTALGGAGLLVLGVVILRNPLIGALTFALLAGSLFLTTGLVRIFASGQFGRDRWLLIVTGLVSLGMGFFVLSNLVTATLSLVGVLLGVETLIEGVTLLVAGRVRSPRQSSAAPVRV
jgi:uncharacterized membrane protein HdeD (DUF308 family)